MHRSHCRPGRIINPFPIIFILVLILFLQAGCEKQDRAYHEQFLAFGTLIEVKLWGVKPEQGARAVRKLAEDFNYLHGAWHAWNPGPVSRINQFLPTGDEFTVSPSTLPLLRRAKELSKSSEGLFNPAIGKLVKLWGFDASEAPKGPPPSKAEIEQLLATHPSMEQVRLNGIHLRGQNPNVRLDFGGFAKGLGVDFAIQHLRDMGINNAVVNAGGDLRAIGSHGERPWRIGIRNPRGEGVFAAVDVQGDESVFTSGDYERYFVHDGVRYHHILDPRSGYPARGSVSVTVFDHDAGRADAAATALFVAGPDDWYRIAKKMGVGGVMLIDHRGVVHMTPNLKDRIYINVEPKPKIIFSEPL